jgi:hypothetical protein
VRDYGRRVRTFPWTFSGCPTKTLQFASEKPRPSLARAGGSVGNFGARRILDLMKSQEGQESP